MDEYIKVEVANYVKKGIENGLMIPQQAEKYKRINAVKGYFGEEIISWSTDSNGNAIKEKVATVKRDPETNKTDWIATKVDEEGQIVFDKNGNINQWLITDSTFKKKYERDPENHNLFKPTGGIQTFVQIPNNIILSQWGEEMKIAMGGYINITNPDDMYGISKKDFEDTYHFIDNQKKDSGPIKNKILEQF